MFLFVDFSFIYYFFNVEVEKQYESFDKQHHYLTPVFMFSIDFHDSEIWKEVTNSKNLDDCDATKSYSDLYSYVPV